MLYIMLLVLDWPGIKAVSTWPGVLKFAYSCLPADVGSGSAGCRHGSGLAGYVASVHVRERLPPDHLCQHPVGG